MAKAGLVTLFADASAAVALIVAIAAVLSEYGVLFALLAGIILAGILAATMSTADVQLLAAASAIAQNIIRGVFGAELSDKKSMVVARVTVLGVAVCGVLFALDPSSAIFRFVSFAWAGFGATFGPIVLFSLYWKRCNKWGAIAGMFSGAAMVFTWKYAIAPIGGALAIYELLPAFVTSCIFIVVVSLLTGKPEKEIIEDYKAKYDVDPALLDAKYDSLFIAAKEEAAMVNMMRANGCTAGVDNFEDLGALPQLPGVGPQRFPSEYGWGFSAEGDWKTAVLVRIGAVMGYGLEGGASLMEDYSYNFTEGDELDMGSHMLEVSPSIGTIAKPKLEIHPLGIGGKADPVRLVFSGKPAKDAVVVSMSDVRERFRLLMDVVDVVEPQGSLKELPCARAVWEPKPSLKPAVECWIPAGGSHHTCMTTSVGREAWEDFARIAGVELAVIDENTTARQFEKELELSEMYHRLNNQH